MNERTVAQNRLIHDIAALEATEHPKGTVPGVALKIDTHFMFHVSVTTVAARPTARPCGRPRGG